MSKDEQAERITENYTLMVQEAAETGVMYTYQDFEDVFEDRDPFEFI